MRRKTIHTIITSLIATVWLINGLLCKVLNLVPRHKEIVSRILGNKHAAFFTIAIGAAEILMAIWILSAIKTRLNAMLQLIIIATMNSIEFFCVPGLLLWGKWNALYALLFMVVIYYNEFVLNKKNTFQN